MDSTPHWVLNELEQEERDRRERGKPTILPTGMNEDVELRKYHEDIRRMGDVEIVAERDVLQRDLSDRVFFKRRPESVYRAGHRISDVEWLQERITRLTAELQRRRARSGRAA